MKILPSNLSVFCTSSILPLLYMINLIKWIQARTIPQNEIIITPLATTLLQNKEQIYDVYLYINGIQQSDVFVFSHSDVPSANYKFDIINGNSFKLTNIYLYPNNPLKISCTTGIENRDIYVNLKGLWWSNDK